MEIRAKSDENQTRVVRCASQKRRFTKTGKNKSDAVRSDQMQSEVISGLLPVERVPDTVLSLATRSEAGTRSQRKPYELTKILSKAVRSESRCWSEVIRCYQKRSDGRIRVRCDQGINYAPDVVYSTETCQMLEFMGSDVIRSYQGELQEESEVVRGNTTISSDGVRRDQKGSEVFRCVRCKKRT